MGFAFKKSGVEFQLKLDTGADLAGEAANFVASYVNDATKTKVEITDSFVESADFPGLYYVPVTIADIGEYTFSITNDNIGMDNHTAPVTVMASDIDDVKSAIDALRVVADTVAADVDGLDGQNLQDIKDNIAAVKALLDDEDDTTRNSVLEFLEDIAAAIENGGSGLAALAGFTDDVENMLLGTEYLADGTTENPFYDAENPGVAKESTLVDSVVALQTSIGTAKDAIIANSDANKDLILDATTAIQTVVDANKATLEDAGFGLAALKTLIDNVNTAVTSGETNILNELGNSTYGLEILMTTLENRFDSVDTDLQTIIDSVNSGNAAQSYSVFA